MPRWLPIVLITSVASIATTTVFAGDKPIPDQLAQDRPFSRDKGPGPQLGGRLSRLREEESQPIPSARYLIYQRARRRAETRSAILEAQQWTWYSDARYDAANRNPGPYKHWVLPYLRERGSW